jgi:hypothetical protein
MITGNGESIFILDGSFNSPDIAEILKEGEDFDGYEEPDDFSLPKIRRFWHVVQRLNPIFYVCDWVVFTLISRDKAGLAEFVENASFKSVENKTKQDAFAQRAGLWSYYWNLLGPECGPETCVANGCERLRIEVAVFCLRHQLELNNPGWFGSGRYFNPTAKRFDFISVDASDVPTGSKLIDKNEALIKLADSDKVQRWREPFEIQSLPQKVLSTIWSLQDEVFNGGFAQYFVNSSSETASFAVTAFETIGALTAANICSRAIQAAFPEGLPDTPEAIRKSVEGHYEELARKLEPWTQEFFSCHDDVTDRLYQFVKKYPNEFGDIS